jgi:hypothetical protein
MGVELPNNFILLVCVGAIGSIVGFIVFGLIVGFENTLKEPQVSSSRRGPANSGHDKVTQVSSPEEVGISSGMRIDWKEIANRMGQLGEGQRLRFRIPATFGGDFAIIESNPDYPGEGQKKYQLKLGKNDGVAEQARPYWSSDRPKDLARWVSDRLGGLVN